MSFFAGSAVGLAIDLIGFQLLILAGLSAWQSNAISSTASIVAVYFLVTRFAFRAEGSATTFVVFLCWYALSIASFSALIDIAASSTGSNPFLWKIASVPVSFALNYVFSRLLFKRFRPRDPQSGVSARD